MPDVIDVLLRAKMDASGVNAGVGQIQKSLKNLTLPKNISDNLEKGFSKLTPLLRDYQKQLEKGFSSKKDLQNFNALRSKIEDVFSELERDISRVNAKEIRLKVDDKAIKDLEKSIASSQSKIDKAMDSIYKSGNSEASIKKATKDIGKIFSETWSTGKIKIPALADLGKELSKSLRTKDFTGFNTAIDKIKAKISSLSEGSQRDLARKLGIKEAGLSVDQLNQKFKNFFNNLQFNKTHAGTIARETETIKQLNNELNNVKTNAAKNSINELGNAARGLKGASEEVKRIGDSGKEAATGILSAKEQIDQLKTSTQYFFSLRNMFSLLKRGIDDAVASVRDLDKAMTETAVVTDFSVADMWKMLPEYTALANKLGATTQGAYETMTLYFQQGLDKQATFEIGEETMKMARIAGLDYAQTTNMMTAALRGFNMELNQTSAKRVNDVYSELAAITASDTRELGLAMERTASIAHSANMEFGNTAAFLAQMIETTREAPENLGTAMKTIIARFQELKENPYSISEVEGEEVDFNRIDKALKTIGVDLMDSRDKFRDLDEVFMEISSKWDGLSQTQQRYIATIAAGSRQQSRFLAMVQNYDRLKELTEAAANSEGASQVQFNKTLDSFESKTNKLKNAWQQFSMSIANNKIIKGFIDGLTGTFTIVNKLIDTFSRGNSVVKSFLSLFTAFAGLKVAGRFVNSAVGALGGLIDPQVGFRQGIKQGFTGKSRAENSVFAREINRPIVDAIKELTAAVKNGEVRNDDKLYRHNLVKDTRKQLYDLATQKDTTARISDKTGRQKIETKNKKFSSKQVLKTLDGLSDLEQKSVGKSSPLIVKALERGYSDAFKTLGYSDKVNKAAEEFNKKLMTGARKGNISLSDALIKRINPYYVGQQAGGEVAKEINDSLTKQLPKEIKKKSGGKVTQKAGGKVTRRINSREALLARQGEITGQKVLDKATGQLTNAESAASKVGGAFTAAGQAVTGFSMVLDSLGLEGASAACSALGSSVMGVGMAVEGAVAGFAALGPAMLGVVAAGLAMGGVIALIHHEAKEREKVLKAGVKVYKDYEKNIEKSAQNITKLTDLREDYIKLSQGVDVNNNNVSLGSEEYADYLKIVNEIAKMQPELVKGYNAHGQAILKNNNAVDEAIQLEKKRAKEAEKNLTKTESLDKLIATRNATKRWKKGQDSVDVTSFSNKNKEHAEAPIKNNELKAHAKEVITNIQNLENGDEILQNIATKFGIQVSDLVNLSEQGMRAIQERGATILSEVESSYTEVGAKAEKKLAEVQDSIAQVGKDTEGIKEVTEPIYKSLSTYASQEGIFDNVPEEFKDAAEAGLREISKLTVDVNGDKITGKAMQSMAKSFGDSLSDMGGHADQYKEIMEGVSEAQEQYVQNADESSYLSNENIKKATELLGKWGDEAQAQYQATGKITDKLLAETYQNQLETIKNFTTESTAILSEGFNTFSDIITASNSAYDSFKKKIEGGDFYTGAENFKQIFDEIEDGIDNAGRGSQTFWKGAKELLGENNKNIEEGRFGATQKQIKALKPMFKEGQDGVEAFLDHVQKKQKETVDSIKGKDGLPKAISDIIEVTDTEFNLHATDFTEDQFSDLANKLGMSDQMLASMLNKAKQFYKVDFKNVDVLRKGLLSSESTITGTGKTGKNTNLYTRRSTFEAEAEAEGYTPKDIKELRKDASKNGIKLVKDAQDITQKDMGKYISGMGIENLKEFISSFSQLGFSREEIKSLYDNKDLGVQKLDKEEGEDFNSVFSDFVKERDEAVLDSGERTVNAINDTNSLLSQILAVNGGDNGQKALAEVYGEKGKIDSEADYFAHGKDIHNRKFSSFDDYSRVKNNLEQQKSNNESMIAAIEKKLPSTTDSKERESLEETLKNYQHANKLLDDRIELGKKAWEQIEQSNNAENEQNENNKKSAEEKRKAFENYMSSLNTESELMTPGELQKKFGLSDEDLEEYKKKVKELTDIAPESDAKNKLGDGIFNLLKLDQLPTDQLQTFTNTFATVKKEAGLTDQEVGKLGLSLSKMPQDKLSSLTEEDFGNLIKQLGLTDERLDEISKKDPKLKIQVDSEEGEQQAKTGAEKIAQKIAKNVQKVPIKYEPQPVSGVVGKVGQAAGKAGKQIGETIAGVGNKIKETTPVQQKLAVNYQATIENEQEIKTTLQTKIKEILASVGKQNHTLKVKGTAQVTTASKSKKTVTTTKNVTTNTNKNTKVTTKTSGQGDVTALSAAIRNVASKTVSIKANTKGTSVVQSLANKIKELKDKTVTLTTNKVTNTKNNLYGQNNRIPHRSLPTFGSAARGSHGTLGPKNRGGLTLTGEKGFEIAWLPSENRSMILGTTGPQMLNLPSDAVVYSHEQSKDILKKNQTIHGGSARRKINDSKNKRGGGGGGTPPKKPPKPSKPSKPSKPPKSKPDKDAKKNNDKQWRILKDAAKINYWWWNMTKKVEATQRKIDDLTDKVKKAISRFGKTIDDIKSNFTSAVTNLNRQIGYNTTMRNKANNNLKKLDKGDSTVSKNVSKAQARVNKAEKKLKKAQATKNKTAIKNAKKELASAKKNLNNQKKGINYQNISYEITKKKGSKTKKVKRKAKVNLANYIYYDEASGAYQVDYNKINKNFKYGSARKAVGEKAKSLLEDYQGKKDTAEDNIKKAREALNELTNEVYDAFYGWKRSITEIYLISQKLETITKGIDTATSQAELEYAKLEAGIGDVETSLPRVQQALEKQRDLLLEQAEGTKQKLIESEKEFEEVTNFQTYIDKFVKSTNKLGEAATNGEDALHAAAEAFDLLQEYGLDSVDNFNYQDAIKALYDKGYDKDDYDKIKEVLDDIFEKQNDYLSAIEEAYKTQADIYKTIEEMQAFVADFETDLLSGIEEQAEDEINRLEKLNSSLSKAFKDLLDEVKRRLEERRRQEDNAKTESDISKKQQRLAALRADTSGGHQVEIAQLEKEIAEAQQSYQRTLEDQLLDRLQEQGDEAERQRERQIELLETQKEIAKQTGTNLEQVKLWLQDPGNNLQSIKAAWLANNNYEEATPEEQKQLEQKFWTEWTKFLAYNSALPSFMEKAGEELPPIQDKIDDIADNVKTIADNFQSTDHGLSKLRESGLKAKSAYEYLQGLGKTGAEAARAMHDAGYTDEQIHGAGVSTKDFKTYLEGLGVKGIAAAKRTKEAGYKPENIAKAFGSSVAMKAGIVTGKEAQKANSTSAKTLQAIINKSKNDEATQKDLADVTVSKVDVNGKEKGGIGKSAHISNSGENIGVNIGSTFYSKAWDKKKGEPTSGKWKKTTIDKLTVNQIKSYADAKDALKYAIEHNKLGTKINPKFKDLIAAANWFGNKRQFKLINGVEASIGSDGLIYYNDSKNKVVKKWNAATGKISIHKYNKAEYQKKTKDPNVGREYKQILKKRGVAYATGGLADFTGPAWLDGTPSKPELVLNSTDTKNFIALRDVLSNAMGSANAISNNYGGDMNYEININVDHLNNDYDVDRVAERVKKIIVKDAGYRNVTQVRNLR